MNNDKQTDPKQRAYTGETIAMRQERRPTPPPSTSLPQRPSHTRRRIWPKIRLALIVMLVFFLLGVIFAYIQVLGIASHVGVQDVRPNAPISSPLLGSANVLVIGVDERPDHPEEGVRSDTMIIAHLDSGGRWTSLLSIPRDTLVEVPDIGFTKLNVAYGHGYTNAETLYGIDTTPHQGGMALTAQTIEQFLGWPTRGQRIDYVMQVNFDGFAQIIDALGGVTIDVPERIIDDAYPNPDFSTRRVEFQPGPQIMDGETALVYARTRHGDSDFARNARQQQVIRAIVTEFQQRGPVGQVMTLPNLREGLDDAVATTMPLGRIDVLLALAWVGSGLNPDDIGQVRFTPELDPQVVEDGNFSLIWSEDGKRAATDAMLTPPGEASERATVQVLNGTGVNGLAGQISGDLESDGFTIIPATDAPTTDVQQTLVYDVNGNKPRTSRRLADTLNADVRQGPPEGVASTADIVVILGFDVADG
ncbi:MAG: LytR family transcriptional regulator [Chloroflexi bacterium AL-W]|nr:LytR family transcriptional regulator [Chloroflexi bacterium AL-N1]NOK66197.1 LytR family transcriptional regulator [Chloroflexi bacterium AL-N10]NOK73078.1 LytR family transcriptional regulator [Chloroflexi bacterium AL-N5]NOK79975.1 LytR family transcriptional regulator [Chloroflexi bacterium AL-W]NOK88169.1 LytR family transcriptional regulator [Chloroflexi bacterium AL-N15]